jgi:anti-sigma factor RsiW
MFDCANVEMRELLPELAAGTLDAASRARVESHVQGCAECASELETLRLVRASFTGAPPLNTRRIVAALPKRPLQGSRPASPTPRVAARWVDWRVAAALTMITVGGLSVAVTQRHQTDRRGPIDSAVVSDIDSAVRMTEARTPPSQPRASDTGRVQPPNVTTPPTRAASKAQLAFGRDDDLDAASLRELLAVLDEIDRGPVAPSAEPDPSSVLPVIRDGRR